MAFLRFLLVLLIVYVAYLFLRIFLATKSRMRRVSTPRRSSGVMVKDEVCNTYIPREEALIEVRDGVEHFFCSEECRRTFLKR